MATGSFIMAAIPNAPVSLPRFAALNIIKHLILVNMFIDWDTALPFPQVTMLIKVTFPTFWWENHTNIVTV
jgi:hypothetical protein